MAPLGDEILGLVSEAVVIWTGKGNYAWPHREDGRLVERYGAEIAQRLVPIVHKLEDEFYESDLKDTVNGLKEMGDAAASRFAGLHPELTGEAVEALAWCYSFDYK